MSASKYTSQIPIGYCQCGCGQKTSRRRDANPKLGIEKGGFSLYVVGHGTRNKFKDIRVRFWSKVKITANDELCWEWEGAVNLQGYGHFQYGGRGGRQISSHRFSWEMAHGEIPKGIHVCHKCDNPKCVNPKHLFLGTNMDNVKDKVVKGRQLKGETIRQHKVTLEQVEEIRNRYAKGGIMQIELSREYGLSKAQICRIVNKLNWNWYD